MWQDYRQALVLLPPPLRSLLRSLRHLRICRPGPSPLPLCPTFGALSPIAATYSEGYIELAALLAIVVGLMTALIGLVRAGFVAYLLSQPVILGFTTGAAILIISSQLPVALAVLPDGDGVVERAWWTLSHPAAWESEALVLAIITSVFMVFGRRIHILLPGVLIAVIGATVWAEVVGYGGPSIGDIPSGLPTLGFDLPWSRLPDLIVPDLVIALVGFAEPAAIARAYAAKGRTLWSPDREFVSQGVANIATGLFGGFPASGSFAGTSINCRSGAQTRWSVAVTGVVVLAFLPFAFAVSSLPRAVVPLIKPAALASIWRFSPFQAIIGWGTAAATVALSPRIEQGVLVGIIGAVLIHLWREREVIVDLETRRDGAARLTPRGVFWLGSAPDIEDSLLHLLSVYPETGRLQIDLSGLGRVDCTSAAAPQGSRLGRDEGRPYSQGARDTAIRLADPGCRVGRRRCRVTR
jgi:SulP family sulfate permease